MNQVSNDGKQSDLLHDVVVIYYDCRIR